ncbi:MAG: hypothetical protein DIKNOCCD_02533 [bacterium]|nr:hypothetical protein [bacterium]
MDALLDLFLDFTLGRPDIFEIDRLAAIPQAEGFAAEIDIDFASQGISDHQRRRGEVVGAHLRMDSPFKIPVPR